LARGDIIVNQYNRQYDKTVRKGFPTALGRVE
jgi:hypothetical protein